MRTPSVWKAPFQINSTDFGPSGNVQTDGHVVATSSGAYIEVWTDISGAYGGSEIVARQLNADGSFAPAGEVGLVAGGTGPDIGIAADQQLVVAYNIGGYTFLRKGLALQWDTALEADSLLSAHPVVTPFSDDGLFVAYTLKITNNAWDIAGRWVDQSGNAEARITLAHSGNKLDNAHIATLSNGNFVVVYDNAFTGQGGAPYGTWFSIWNEHGAPIKVETAVGVESNVINTTPDVTALASGGFVVTYTNWGPGYGFIHADVYDSAGNLVRNDFVVNSQVNDYLSPHATAMPDGGFLVEWRSNYPGTGSAQLFDSSGNKIGIEFSAYGSSSGSDVATLSDGRTVFSSDDASSSRFDITNVIYETRTNINNHVTGHDLFGDGTSDTLILRATTANNGPGGLLTMYDLSATSALTQIGQIGTDWSVAGSGDFNGDGRSDILMQHDTNSLRDIYSFTMGATQVTAITKLGAVGPDWQLDGSGDFDGDGFKDILIERVNGGTKELDIIGVKSGAVNSLTVAASLASTYQVDGIGDMNKDGKADILTHYDDAAGRHFVELDEVNDTTQAVKGVATIGKEWNAAGMGDFNGDGYADILIVSDTASARDLGILINQGGNGWVFKDLGPIVGKNVQIDGIGDFNSDGTADISAHYDNSGTSRIDIYFEMHNSATTAIHTTGAVGHEWIVS